MNAGVIENGRFVETRIGVPQGGNLSPLLSNIMLNELDKELERRGHKFVRYADDCMILCKSKRAAQRTLDHIIPFIEDKLHLKVNRDKTVVAHVKDVKFLGHGFYINKGKVLLRVHPKSITKMKEKIKSTFNEVYDVEGETVEATLEFLKPYDILIILKNEN